MGYNFMLFQMVLLLPLISNNFMLFLYLFKQINQKDCLLLSAKKGIWSNFSRQLNRALITEQVFFLFIPSTCS